MEASPTPEEKSVQQSDLQIWELEPFTSQEERNVWLYNHWEVEAEPRFDSHYGLEMGIGIAADNRVFLICSSSQKAVENALRERDVDWFNMRVETITEPGDGDTVLTSNP